MRDVIILGSGPAGLTAGVYAARAHLTPLIVDGHEPGGQLTLTTMVENFPGFPEGLLGPDLIRSMRQQAERFGAEFRQGAVTTVVLGRPPFRITIDGMVEECRALIIATGASAKMLGLPSERQLIGHGVSTCATCDGFFFQDQEVMVVGAGEKVEPRPIKVVRTVGDNWLASDGLKTGDRVILEGIQKARPGTPVKAVPFGVRPAAAPGGAAQPATAPAGKK